MKALVLCSIFFMSFSALADKHDGMEGKTFEEKKAKALEGIEKRLSFINETKTCVTAATDENALKACREKMKAHRKTMKESRQKRREEKKN
jgi:hypothetical protein